MLSDLLFHGPAVRVLKPGKSAVDLHAMAVGAGYERRENEAYSWEGRGRGAFSVIQHTISGRGELDFAGTRHALLAGDTMLLNFPHANRYWLAPGQRWEYFWIGVNGREALRITRTVIDAAGPVLRLGSGVIDRLADVCRALVSAELPAGETSALAYAAVMALHDGAFQSAVTADDELPLAIRRTLAHIDGHLADRLDVERLAGIAGLSRAHFVRIFTGAVGEAPSNYVMARRIALAERLLTATDATIADIAAACGFADGNYFAKVFRREARMTPTAFRAARLRRLGSSRA